MNAIDLIEWILVIVGILFIIIMIFIIIAMVASIVTFEKEETVEEEKKESYLVHITFKEQALGGSHTTKLIYVKATSPKEALKRAEEYYIEHCSIPALKSLYEKGEITVTAKCIDDCIMIR